MKPQSVHSVGGMGKIQRQEDSLLRDARAAQQAGAFSIVLELIPQAIAARITRELAIPTIGIGAGPACDGQVLVGYDMLGLTGDFYPRFLKKFMDLRAEAVRGLTIRSGSPQWIVPGPERARLKRKRARELPDCGLVVAVCLRSGDGNHLHRASSDVPAPLAGRNFLPPIVCTLTSRCGRLAQRFRLTPGRSDNHGQGTMTAPLRGLIGADPGRHVLPLSFDKPFVRGEPMGLTWR